MSGAAIPASHRPTLRAPVRPLSDERLVRRAADGDQRAFAAIFERHHQALYRYCRSIVGNGDDASDALQNTMARVLRALPGEERTIALKPWLYRIAHNESLRIIGSRRGEAELDSAPEPAGPSLEGSRPRASGSRSSSRTCARCPTASVGPSSCGS